jgi:hypothetical protein
MSMTVANRRMQDLQAAVSAVCPNAGVYIGIPETQATWGFHPAPGATQEQIAAGTAAIAAMDAAAYIGPDGSIFKLETCYENRRREYPVAGDQLDALMKGLDVVKATITLPQDTLDWIDACKAVKTQYPKP